MNPLHLVLTDTDVHALQARNAERAARARQKLGKHWCCHPANQVLRTTPFASGWKPYPAPAATANGGPFKVDDDFVRKLKRQGLIG